MANFIVSYDLSKPNRDYDRIINAIDAYNSVRITESCWLINTYNTAVGIRDYLKQFIDSDDKLAVIKLGDDWATVSINTEAKKWLKQYV